MALQEVTNYTNIDDKFDLQEGQEYSRGAEFNKPALVDSAFRKIQESRGQEMREGYFNILELPNGSIKKVYIPDTRQEFVNSVKYAISLLTPEIESTKEIKESISKLLKEESELLKKYSVKKLISDGNGIVESEETYLPSIDEDVPIKVLIGKSNGTNRMSISFKRGYYNFNVRMYWNGMVTIYDKMFTELNKLVALKDYYKQQSSY